MVRNYKRKNIDEPLTESKAKEIVMQKKTSGISFRKLAQQGVSKSTIHRLTKKIDLMDPSNCTLQRSCHNRQVFTTQQESELADYLIVAQQLNHGLTPADTRKLAYNYAKANQIGIPSRWHLKEEAGPDWFSLFMKRNPILSIRKPERTSQARAAAVNHPVIDKFYDDLFNLYVEYKFPPEKIFNCDETNNPTVVDPQNIIAERGAKAVSSSTGGEQGINVTMLAFVNAAGDAFPGVFIYPRKNVNLEKMVDLPEGFLPLAHQSGWMNEDLFLISLQHLKKQVVCSPEDPILLTMDNHISHISYKVVDYCKNNGIVLFTLPPHTSHVLQPLDKGLFGPMKEDMKKEHREWMRLHPGQRIGIYDVPRLTKGPYQRRFTAQNIKSSFAACGIYPFNRNAIPENMFVPSSVTDLPAVESVATTGPFPESQQTDAPPAVPAVLLVYDPDLHHLSTSGNSFIERGASHVTVGRAPLNGVSQYVLAVDSSTGKITFTPLWTPTTTPLPSNEALCLPVNEANVGCQTKRNPSPSHRPYLNQDQVQSYPLATRSSGEPRRHLTPEEVLPHPRVSQTGPRIPRNKNRGASRVLTSSAEFAKLKETFDAKVLKEANKILKESTNLPKKRHQKASGGKAGEKSGITATTSKFIDNLPSLAFSEIHSATLTSKTRKSGKKTNVTTNDENVSTDGVEYIPGRASTIPKPTRKLRSVNRQLF